MKTTAFCGIELCSLTEADRQFRCTHCLHHQRTYMFMYLLQQTLFLINAERIAQRKARIKKRKMKQDCSIIHRPTWFTQNDGWVSAARICVFRNSAITFFTPAHWRLKLRNYLVARTDHTALRDTVPQKGSYHCAQYHVKQYAPYRQLKPSLCTRPPKSVNWASIKQAYNGTWVYFTWKR